MSTTLHIQTASPEETESLGKCLAPFIPTGTIVALYGDLAAGKTCLVHGIARAHGVNEAVSSPTFTIINEYHGTETLFHLDLYRFTTAREIYDLGYEELFDNPAGICLVEWAERADTFLPKKHVSIRLSHQGENERTVTIEDESALRVGWREALLAQFSQVN